MDKWTADHLENWIERMFDSLRAKSVARDGIKQFVAVHPEVIAEGALFSWPEILKLSRRTL